jgi:hypothetical protein
MAARNLLVPLIGAAEFRVNVNNNAPVVELEVVDHLTYVETCSVGHCCIPKFINPDPVVSETPAPGKRFVYPV